jgi:hypothetical protein
VERVLILAEIYATEASSLRVIFPRMGGRL